MIDISTLSVSGFIGAIIGMRKPLKSGEQSDSIFEGPAVGSGIIGEKDLELCQKLLRAGGDDHSKFMRMIHVQADVNAPLYWWKEFDTYKVATVENSESTMHTIHKSELTEDNFSHEEFPEPDPEYYNPFDPGDEGNSFEERLFYCSIAYLNIIRESYLKAVEDKDSEKAEYYWRNLIQLLPESYMQSRVIDLNYQTLRRIYFARRNHKLDEWHKFCDWIKTLPYAEELITYKPNEVRRDMA